MPGLAGTEGCRRCRGEVGGARTRAVEAIRNGAGDPGDGGG